VPSRQALGGLKHGAVARSTDYVPATGVNEPVHRHSGQARLATGLVGSGGDRLPKDNRLCSLLLRDAYLIDLGNLGMQSLPKFLFSGAVRP